jgi:hypothetical protein
MLLPDAIILTLITEAPYLAIFLVETQAVFPKAFNDSCPGSIPGHSLEFF